MTVRQNAGQTAYYVELRLVCVMQVHCVIAVRLVDGPYCSNK